jgi:hypothetical protein
VLPVKYSITSKIPSRRGTEGSNPSLSGGESANPRSRSVVALIPPDLARSSSSLDAARYDAKLDFKQGDFMVRRDAIEIMPLCRLSTMPASIRSAIPSPIAPEWLETEHRSQGPAHNRPGGFPREKHFPSGNACANHYDLGRLYSESV